MHVPPWSHPIACATVPVAQSRNPNMQPRQQWGIPKSAALQAACCCPKHTLACTVLGAPARLLAAVLLVVPELLPALYWSPCSRLSRLPPRACAAFRVHAGPFACRRPHTDGFMQLYQLVGARLCSQGRRCRDQVLVPPLRNEPLWAAAREHLGARCPAQPCYHAEPAY